MKFYKGDIAEVINFGRTSVYMKDGWECDYYGNHLAKRVGLRFKVKQVGKENDCLWVESIGDKGSFETPDFYYNQQLILYRRPFVNHLKDFRVRFNAFFAKMYPKSRQNTNK